MKELAQHRPAITFVHSCHGNSKLEVLKLVKTNLNRTSKIASQQEEGCSVCYTMLVTSFASSPQHTITHQIDACSVTHMRSLAQQSST